MIKSRQPAVGLTFHHVDASKRGLGDWSSRRTSDSWHAKTIMPRDNARNRTQAKLPATVLLWCNPIKGSFNTIGQLIWKEDQSFQYCQIRYPWNKSCDITI